MLCLSILLNTFLIAAESDTYKESDKARVRWAKSLDYIEDNDTRQTVIDHIKADYGLRAYNENYLIVGYREGNYNSYVPSDEYINHEVEMQISLSYDFGSNFFGLDEVYSGAITLRSFWQVFTESSPFRETNYNPEVFVTIPTYTDSWIGLKAVKFSPFAHMSNGQGDITDADFTGSLPSSLPSTIDPNWLTNRSRSWNYMYGTLFFQQGPIFAELTAWYRYPEAVTTDDNPDLIDYIGHGSATIYLPYKKHLFKTMGRYNPETGYGAIEGTWSYPIEGQSTYLYLKVFSGYGESLIDYNNYVTKFSLGFSFSR